MLRSLVQFVVQLRNVFPPLDGISNTMNPTTIVTGLIMPNAAHFSLEFGEYVHVHDNMNTTNDINPPQYTPAIALLPANCNAGWYFMSLVVTGLWILRYKWDSLPVTTDVVHRVYQLAHPTSTSKRKQRAYDSFTFEWTPGSPVQPIPLSDLPPLLGVSIESGSEPTSVVTPLDSTPEGSVTDTIDDFNYDALNVNDVVISDQNDLSHTINNEVEDTVLGEDPSYTIYNEFEHNAPSISDDPHVDSDDVANDVDGPPTGIDDVDNVANLPNDLEIEPNNLPLSHLLQPDAIEAELNNNLLSLQNLEDDFIQESDQLATQLCDITQQTSTSRINDSFDSGLESRSTDDDVTIDVESRNVGDQSTTYDELRSVTTPPPSQRSDHYDLCSNPSQTAYSGFNIENYRYSFLQQATQERTAVELLIDDIDQAWKKEDSKTESEHAEAVKNGLQSNFSKAHCKKVISSKLKRMQKHQFYHKNRLCTCLIRLMHIIMFTPLDSILANSNICLTQMSA